MNKQLQRNIESIYCVCDQMDRLPLNTQNMGSRKYREMLQLEFLSFVAYLSEYSQLTLRTAMQFSQTYVDPSMTETRFFQIEQTTGCLSNDYIMQIPSVLRAAAKVDAALFRGSSSGTDSIAKTLFSIYGMICVELLQMQPIGRETMLPIMEQLLTNLKAFLSRELPYLTVQDINLREIVAAMPAAPEGLGGGVPNPPVSGQGVNPVNGYPNAAPGYPQAGVPVYPQNPNVNPVNRTPNPYSNRDPWASSPANVPPRNNMPPQVPNTPPPAPRRRDPLPNIPPPAQPVHRTKQSLRSPLPPLPTQGAKVPQPQKSAAKTVPSTGRELRQGERAVLTTFVDQMIEFRLTFDELMLDMDIDAYAFLLDEQGKVFRDEDLVFFGNPNFERDVVAVDTQCSFPSVRIKLSALPDKYKRAAICFSAYGDNDWENFQQVKNPVLQMIADGQEVYHLPLKLTLEKTVVGVELYQRNGVWKLNAVAAGYHGKLRKLCESYGVEIE